MRPRRQTLAPAVTPRRWARTPGACAEACAYLQAQVVVRGSQVGTPAVGAPGAALVTDRLVVAAYAGASAAVLCNLVVVAVVVVGGGGAEVAAVVAAEVVVVDAVAVVVVAVVVASAYGAVVAYASPTKPASCQAAVLHRPRP